MTSLGESQSVESPRIEKDLEFNPEEKDSSNLPDSCKIIFDHSESVSREDESTEVQSEVDYEETVEVFEDPAVLDSRLQELEDEQEHLNSSLIALTSHFAQVQLRLKQIVAADDEGKEALLKELEEFAFRGIPDFREPTIDLLDERNDECSETDSDKRWEEQRTKQKELIAKLKNQLQDLEQYAYETGHINSLPSSMILERQSVIIEQLKGRLPLNLDQMDKLSPEELRKQVDQAVRELMNPVLMREQLVDQLKTQVTDLERFIEHLQKSQIGKRCVKNSSGECTCDCPLHGNSQTSVESYNEFVARERKRQAGGPGVKYGHDGDGVNDASQMIKRVVTLLQMITFAQFGCNSELNKYQSNLKKTSKGPHWGDLKAKLDLAVERIAELDKEKFCNDSDYTSDSDDNVFVAGNEIMTTAVRKELSPALKDLLEHGLIQVTASSENRSLIVGHLLDWTCLSNRGSQSTSRKMTAWDLLLQYYHFKNGNGFSSCPSRRLSQSFNLQMIGGISVTPKQSLLTAISDIRESHTPLKRSPDSHFKAFVSRGLNEGRLVLWIRLLVKNRRIVETCYEPWSYTASTGFDDALKSLEKLQDIHFDLPIDLAVRQLKNISEAF